MSDTKQQPEQVSEDHAKALDHAIGQIDLAAVSKEDIVLDFIGRLRRFNFESMVALRLLEKISIEERYNESKEQSKAE
jgi:hypothetical protein